MNRLEEFPQSSIEYAGGRPVIQYRGEILPLISLGRVLRSGKKDTAFRRDPIQAVVFRMGTRSVGLVVDEIIDIAADVVQASNDKQQLEPMLEKIADLPDELGKVGELLADNGYFSEANVNACAAAGIEPVIAMGREAHHPSLDERFAEPPPSPQDPTPLAAMDHRLKAPEGKQRYALRKQTAEPVFGIIKSVLGFRQFLLRGLQNVRGEWSLLTMAWNVKRMFALKAA